MKNPAALQDFVLSIPPSIFQIFHDSLGFDSICISFVRVDITTDIFARQTIHDNRESHKYRLFDCRIAFVL